MANNLGHEVDLDRNEYKYLASEDNASSSAKANESAHSGAGAAAAGAGVAAAGAAGAAGLSTPVGKQAADNAESTASKYEPQNHVVAGADEEHVGTAPEQPDLQEKLDEDNSDYAPSQHIVGGAKEEHIGSAPQQPDLQEKLDEDNSDYAPSQHIVGEANEERVATAPNQDNVNGQQSSERLDQLKGKASEAGSAVGDAFQRAKGFVEDKAHEYQEAVSYTHLTLPTKA